MNKQTIFTGAGVAIVTPMKADGSVNYEKYRELVEWQIENGTDAIIACGTTGESSTLNHEEHIAVMRAAVEQVDRPDPRHRRHWLQRHQPTASSCPRRPKDWARTPCCWLRRITTKHPRGG